MRAHIGSLSGPVFSIRLISWLVLRRFDGTFGSQFPGSNVQSAPLPSFRLIALGSIVQLSLARLSKFYPAAPSGGTPASASVAKISLAVEPFTVFTFLPKVTSQLRTVMSTLPVRQTIRSAVTTIAFL